jgi:hypothetical protein
VSIAGAEHLTLPASYPRLREVGVYVGWDPLLARPLQVGTLIGSAVLRLPGARAALHAAGDRLAQAAPAPRRGQVGRASVRVVAEARGSDDAVLGAVELAGGDPYAFTADLLAWAARRAAAGGVKGTGALGPVEAFGLAQLERGCAQAGLERSPAGAQGAPVPPS